MAKKKMLDREFRGPPGREGARPALVYGIWIGYWGKKHGRRCNLLMGTGIVRRILRRLGWGRDVSLTQARSFYGTVKVGWSRGLLNKEKNNEKGLSNVLSTYRHHKLTLFPTKRSSV